MESRADAATLVQPSGRPASTLRPFITITALFFFWGFITVMNDVLIPFLKESFTLTYLQAALVQGAFFGAFFVVSLIYFVLSIVQGDIINRLGYQRTIVIALCICAAGCALFAPAANAISYPFFLGALFTLATGVTILQIAANPYAAVLGSPENATSRLNLAQGLNSLGTTIAPIVGSVLLYKVFTTDGVVTLKSIQMPYLIYAGLFLLLAAVVFFSRLPAIVTSHKAEAPGGAIAFPQVQLGMIAIFCYVGAEVAIGSFLVNFMKEPTVAGLAESVANSYLAYYWGGLMIGRLCGSIAMSATTPASQKPIYMVLTAGILTALLYVATAFRHDKDHFYMEFLSIGDFWPYILMVGVCLMAFAVGRGRPATTLAIFSSVIVVLLATAALADGKTAMWAALGAGLFNSVMWSNIFTLAIDGLEDRTPQASSLLVMMIVGGAIFPLLMGFVADQESIGIQLSFLVPIVCYVYIAFYGWWCQKFSAASRARVG